MISVTVIICMTGESKVIDVTVISCITGDIAW